MCVSGRDKGKVRAKSAKTIDVKKLGNVLFRTCFFLFTNFKKKQKKKQKDLKVIQGHTHYPLINYTTGFD